MTRDSRQVQALRDLLSGRPRDRLLMELITHTRLSVREILRLKTGDLSGRSPGDPLNFVSSESNGNRPVAPVTPEMVRAFSSLKQASSPGPDTWLFQSRKGGGPLSIQSVSRLAAGWIRQAGLDGVTGIRDLRPPLPAPAAPESADDREPATGKTGPPSSDSGEAQLHKHTLQEKVYTTLERAIITAELPPGSRLVAEEIAKEMSVSRIPVREALGRLATRGLITIRPQSGSVVNHLSRTDFEEILELRRILEPRAAARAAVNTEEKEAFVRQLSRAHDAFARARLKNDIDREIRTNRRFHFILYRQAASPMLLEMITLLWDRVSPYYHMMFRKRMAPPADTGVDLHRQILEAVRAGNAPAAADLLKTDIDSAALPFLDLFDRYHAPGPVSASPDTLSP